MISIPILAADLPPRPLALGQSLPTPDIQVQPPIIYVINKGFILPAAIQLAAVNQNRATILGERRRVTVNPAGWCPRRGYRRYSERVQIQKHHRCCAWAAFLGIAKVPNDNDSVGNERCRMEICWRKNLPWV